MACNISSTQQWTETPPHRLQPSVSSLSNVSSYKGEKVSRPHLLPAHLVLPYSHTASFLHGAGILIFYFRRIKGNSACKQHFASLPPHFKWVMWPTGDEYEQTIPCSEQPQNRSWGQAKTQMGTTVLKAECIHRHWLFKHTNTHLLLRLPFGADYSVRLKLRLDTRKDRRLCHCDSPLPKAEPQITAP